MFGDRMWFAVHILSHLAAKKEKIFLKMTISSSLSGSPLSNATQVKSGQWTGPYACTLYFYQFTRVIAKVGN